MFAAHPEGTQYQDDHPPHRLVNDDRIGVLAVGPHALILTSPGQNAQNTPLQYVQEIKKTESQGHILRHEIREPHHGQIQRQTDARHPLE